MVGRRGKERLRKDTTDPLQYLGCKFDLRRRQRELFDLKKGAFCLHNVTVDNIFRKKCLLEERHLAQRQCALLAPAVHDFIS